MAKKNEIAVQDLTQVPAFMNEDSRDGTEVLSNFIQPPTLKVIQPLTKPPLIDLFTPGDLVLLPVNKLVTGLTVDEHGKRGKTSDKIAFTPIFFWPEWLVYNPLEIKETHGSVRDRTLDPESQIAAKARNPKTRFETCPEKPDKKIAYTEVLNYAVIIMHEDVPQEPAILRFKSGEHRAGTAFNTLIKSRRAPIYGCIFNMQVGYRSNNKGQWFGVDVVNPDENPWVDNKEVYAAFKEAHEEFKRYHANNAIITEDDETEAAESSEF